MSDLDILLEALNYVAITAAYDTTGPDMFYKLIRDIERIRQREAVMEEMAHREAMNEIKND
jgi:hypothetical protein